MAHNKLYRNFIILQEDERGYSHANDKALSGYAKIEAKGDKCKVSFYAQNLKPEDNYSMVLICCKRDLKQLIDIGPLAINEVGKGDTSKEYYVNNIAGLGISYEKISGAAICKTKDNENEFIMHGFMNGEDSVDNWRKFKFIKADSKKYINKLDAVPVKKNNVNLDIANKTITAQASNVEIDAIKTSKLQNELSERKKEESTLQSNENIELEKLDNSDSKVEDDQNRISENHENIVETKDISGEDRKKCKGLKKDEKHSKCDKCDKSHEEGYYQKDENIEETINKLAEKLDNYDGIADIKINQHIHEDVMIYGFIKAKNNADCKWKKFKLEKKCGIDEPDFSKFQNFKRIEENFKLDKLNPVDYSGRMDTIDFDKYESDIQTAKLNNTTGMGQTMTGGMATGTETTAQPTEGTMGTGTETTVQPVAESMGTSGKITVQPTAGAMCTPCTGYEMKKAGTCAENVGQTGSPVFGQLDLSHAEPINLENKQVSPSQFNINGTIGKYFTKIAEGLAPYFGKLIDINYCKWYKINVNSIEDLSDESNYNQYTLAYYPMLNYYPYISKHGHFLVGYKCNKNGDMKYIIYAIPGSKEKNDQPYGGRTGFVTWTSDNESGRGYWLMFYDFKNSSIVIPTK